MAKRTVHIKIKCSIVVDDDGTSLPHIHPLKVIQHGVSTIPGATEILPGGKVDFSFDRATFARLGRIAKKGRKK